MAVTIGSNISSLRTIRQLDGTTRNLASTSERLASGQRINRASDDAAGLAIASSLDATSRVFTKALANVNDGISLLSITDGAMRELGTILTRVKELATQSANGSYSSIQRRALDEEGQKLRDEYNRILATTSFNGVRTLDGSQASVAIQAGSDGISAPLELTTQVVADVSTTRSTNSLNLDGTDDYLNVSYAANQSFGTGSFSLSAWIRLTSAPVGRAAVIDNFRANVDGQRGYILDVTANPKLRGFIDSGGGDLTGNTTLSTNTWYHVSLVRDGDNASLYLNGMQDGSASGLSARNATSNGTLDIGAETENSYFFPGLIDDVRIYNRALAFSEIANLAAGDSISSIGLVAHYDFEEGTGGIAADSSGNGNNGTLTNGAIWSSNTPAELIKRTVALETFSLLTASNARSAMDTIESAFSRLNGEVGKLGSQLSRLQTVINTISSARENYQAAAGRIKDADVAQESANLVRDEILQQTASGVLAQANQQPRLAIQLLGTI